ncbi:MAG TPA: aminotransferase class III-fold pyridoxal phosphate-dependent enzyme, partial [Anaerolineae bacterium]|nr:aminotransferase class III-fold pyridoxal phosphate-dependent enzyme [Anaerolineae bacterium]
KGSKLWDIDGNEYVDITMGFGVSFLGHSPDFVTKAIKERIDRGLEIGPQSQEAGEVAAMLQNLTGAERVSFCNTGSEALMASIRMARTATGRDKVVWFSGDYHGTFDEVLARPQIMRGELHTLPAAPGITADAVKNSYILEYGDPASLDFIREHKDELAAVLIETVQSRHPDNRPIQFVRELRKITEEADMALIFDEVITGFRVHPRGMQHVYGVEPDISCYGKILGGGIPIGAVAGKAKFMDGIDGGWWQYGDDSVPEADLTFFAGTFVRHPMAMAAAKAVLTYLDEQGSALQERVNNKMTAFASEMNAFFKLRSVPIKINHFSSWFRVEAASDLQFMDLFFYHLLEKGLYVFTLHQNCFFSIEHSDADIAKVIAAFKATTIELQEAGFLPAAPDTPFPLSEPQQEILLASQLAPQASLPYNESFSLRLRGQLHLAAMQQAVQAVISRHGALHHRFSLAGDWQKRDLESQVELVLHDFAGNSAEVAATLAKQEMDKILSTPLDLEHGPIVKVQLIKLADDLHLFHWTAHHIVYDGWSAVIVIDEIRTIYNAIVADQPWHELLDEPDNLAEYVQWERAERTSEEGQEALAYWQKQFATIPLPLDLPTDRPRPARQTYNGTSFH